MNFQKRFTKKILFLLIISILSLNLSFFTVPKKASAIIGIADVSITHDPLAFFQAAGKIVWDKGDQYLWNLFKALMRNVAKKMINNITQATVTWINGGMNGKPAFQADLKYQDYECSRALLLSSEQERPNCQRQLYILFSLVFQEQNC